MNCAISALPRTTRGEPLPKPKNIQRQHFGSGIPSSSSAGRSIILLKRIRRRIETKSFVTKQNQNSTVPSGTKQGNQWHAEPLTGLLDLLETRPEGLTGEEVARRQKEFGPNRVTGRRGTPAWLKFLKQFNQPLVYILLVAVGVTAFLGEWVDSSVIFGVVIINAIVGFLQEAKAEKAIEALAKMVATETTVRRDGQKLRGQSEELVPADLRLFHGHNLQADGFALTGESLPGAERVLPGSIVDARRPSCALSVDGPTPPIRA